MNETQAKLVTAVALTTVTIACAWLVLLPVTAVLGIIDGEYGLGWTFGAVLASFEAIEQWAGPLAIIFLTGFTAAGSTQKPSKLSYVAGGSLIAGLAATLFIILLFGDPSYAALIRGTTPFESIDSFNEFVSAKNKFASWTSAGLAGALAALLGISLVKAKKHAEAV